MTEALTRLTVGCLIAAPLLFVARAAVDVLFDAAEILLDEHRARMERVRRSP